MSRESIDNARHVLAELETLYYGKAVTEDKLERFATELPTLRQQNDMLAESVRVLTERLQVAERQNADLNERVQTLGLEIEGWRTNTEHDVAGWNALLVREYSRADRWRRRALAMLAQARRLRHEANDARDDLIDGGDQRDVLEGILGQVVTALLHFDWGSTVLSPEDDRDESLRADLRVLQAMTDHAAARRAADQWRMMRAALEALMSCEHWRHEEQAPSPTLYLNAVAAARRALGLAEGEGTTAAGAREADR